MSAETWRRALGDRRRSLVAWALGMAAYVAMIASVFPSIRGSRQLDQLVKQYPDVLKAMFGIGDRFSLTSGPGYLDSELFSFMLPALMIAMAIGAGAGLLAGEGEQGLLDLLLSQPVSRRSVVVAKALAVACEVALLVAVLWIALVTADVAVGLGLDRLHLIEAVVSLGLLGLFHGWLALAVGAATRHRASAVGVPAGFAAAGFLVGSLHSVAGWLDPFRFVSTFYYAGQSPLQVGVPLRLVVLAVACPLLVAIAVVAFDRRDVVGV